MHIPKRLLCDVSQIQYISRVLESMWMLFVSRQGGLRPDPSRRPRPGGLGVAAALRSPRALPGLREVAAGLQRAPHGAPGEVQDRSH